MLPHPFWGGYDYAVNGNEGVVRSSPLVIPSLSLSLGGCRFESCDAAPALLLPIYYSCRFEEEKARPQNKQWELRTSGRVRGRSLQVEVRSLEPTGV